MPAHQTQYPLLHLHPQNAQKREAGKRIPKGKDPRSFSSEKQEETYGPVFSRLQENLNNNSIGVYTDPTALAPERMLVLEVTGSVQNFYNAIKKTQGFEQIGEFDLPEDNKDKNPYCYLLVPDETALKQLLSLWEKWKKKEEFEHGLFKWKYVFNQLRDLRVWGPDDRIRPEDRKIFKEDIKGYKDDDRYILEIELVFTNNEDKSDLKFNNLKSFIEKHEGKIIKSVRLPEIAYHATLLSIPVKIVREFIKNDQNNQNEFLNINDQNEFLNIKEIMYISPQAIPSAIKLGDITEDITTDDQQISAVSTAEGDSILALLDGVPVSQHVRLKDRLIVHDLFDLEDKSQVIKRDHGTAMASLIIHGDLNAKEIPLRRPVTCIPVLNEENSFASNELIVDIIYHSVISLLEEDKAPHTLIINLSLGNKNQIFYGKMSPWARLLDYLSEKYGILFIVSAGNHTGCIVNNDYRNFTELTDNKDYNNRSENIYASLENNMAERRLLSPAETINGLTIGAYNKTWSATNTDGSHNTIVPFFNRVMTNPSSALGPGFKNAVKPDVVMPGGNEFLRCHKSEPNKLDLETAPFGRNSGGLLVAAPSNTQGEENVSGYTGGTSAAAALASRTAHLIHDALESTYGEDFTHITKRKRALILKALLVHSASWPHDTAEMIRNYSNKSNIKEKIHYSKQKDNIRRYFGFGCVDPQIAVSCAADRATFWICGEIEANKSVTINVPLPATINGKKSFHSFHITLAWFSPINIGHLNYRAVKLTAKFNNGEGDDLNVDHCKDSLLDWQVERGTVCSYRYESDKAPKIDKDSSIPVIITRMKDSFGEAIDYAVAITVSMPGEMTIYDAVKARTALPKQQVILR